jgi:hypothetical protein
MALGPSVLMRLRWLTHIVEQPVRAPPIATSSSASPTSRADLFFTTSRAGLFFTGEGAVTGVASLATEDAAASGRPERGTRGREFAEVRKWGFSEPKQRCWSLVGLGEMECRKAVVGVGAVVGFAGWRW